MTHWQHALISGAGSGLGLGIATRLLARGTDVSVLDLALDDARRAQLVSAAQRGGARWQWLQADITDEAAVRRAVDEAVAAFGAPDLALNSAGIGLSRAFANMTSAQFRRIIDVNLVGSYHFAAATIPHLPRGARLAFIASLAGLTSNYSYAAYGTSKFGVVGLATTLRYEYEPRGIRLSCICPPEVKTPLVDAERVGGDPVALDLKLVAGSMTVDAACAQIVAGLDAGRWMIIPGLSAKLTAFAAQRTPGLFYRAMNLLIRKYMRKHGQL